MTSIETTFSHSFPHAPKSIVFTVGVVGVSLLRHPDRRRPNFDIDATLSEWHRARESRAYIRMPRERCRAATCTRGGVYITPPLADTHVNANIELRLCFYSA